MKLKNALAESLEIKSLGLTLAPGEEFEAPSDPRKSKELFMLRRGGALVRVARPTPEQPTEG